VLINTPPQVQIIFSISGFASSIVNIRVPLELLSGTQAILLGMVHEKGDSVFRATAELKVIKI